MEPAAPRLRDRVEVLLGAAFWCVAGASAALCGAADVFAPYALPVAAAACAWPIVRRRRWAVDVLDWLPFPFVVLTYGMLHALVPACWAATIDPWLAEADRALLGEHAGVLLEPLVSPALTTLMAAFYASYYVLPVSLAAWWWRRDRRAFRELMVGEVGALFVGYLGYLYLPAIGPHAHLPAATFGTALEGDFIGAVIRGLNEVHGGVFPRDAFPSLHTANAVTIVLVALRRERRVLWVYGPAVAGLIAATVYLRFHYVVDVVAGAALAVVWQRAAVGLVARESDWTPGGLQSTAGSRRAA